MFQVITALIAIMASVASVGYSFDAHAAPQNPTIKKSVAKKPLAIKKAAPAAPPVPVSNSASINSGPARETSVDRIVVGVFKANTADRQLAQIWNQKRAEYQTAFVALLNERSYLEAVASNREFTLNENKDVILNEAQREGVDGALVGEFRGHSIELALRSGATGRTLARLTVPLTDIRTQNVRDISIQAVDQVVLSFPYRGFITATSGNQVKLNLGKLEGVKVGTVLEVFEFEGDAPNFSSPVSRVGFVRVVKISSNAAIAQVISSSKPVNQYAKVSFSKSAENDPAADQITTRYHRHLWASVGAEFYYIDTQVSDISPSSPLGQRIYQVPLSPALGFGLGVSRLSLWALVSGLSNQSNNVSLLSGTASFELIRPITKKTSYITSVGLYYANYKASPVAGSPLPLVSVATYSPMLEERVQYVTSPQTKLFFDARLYYPIYSTDSINGNSSIAKSYGAGGDGGIRLDLGKSVAVEGGIQTRYLIVNLPSGGSISEFEYGFFSHLLFLF